jgi:hypothetical protein
MPRKKRRILAGRRLEVDATDAERARFFAKVKPGRTVPDGYESPCLEWAAGVDADGYGRFHYRGRNTLAHRWAYAADVGPVEAGQDVDHGCRNRRCVNSDHLEQKAPSENRPDGRWWAHRNGNGEA